MSAPTAARGCFVTGTDTEVGKTHVSAGLLHWFGRQGLRSAGLKPVAAGQTLVDGRLCNEDVDLLRAASTVALADGEVGPCQFEAACAPHIAAKLEGREISRAGLLQAARVLAAKADVLVVEGVGGFRVPLGADWDSADLAADLGLPVVLVVGLRLGCLNHALLTADAVRARGLVLAGWVGNTIGEEMAWAGDNVATLRAWLAREYGAPCFGIVPSLPAPSAAAVAEHFDGRALRAAFDF